MPNLCKLGRLLYAGTVLATLAALLWLALWREWALRYDTDYPARIIFENNFFLDKAGAPVQDITAGDTVYYRKAFCISLDDPDRLVAELVRGSRGFIEAGDAVLTPQTDHFGTIYGLSRATFVDGVALQVPDRTFEVREGCYDVTQSLRIPATLPPSDYALVFRFTYYRNRWQKGEGQGVTRSATPIRFRVIP